MNKHDLIDAISGQLGSKKTATEAVNALLDTIQVTVAKGDKVAITGFGVFEKAVRPARTARNPATGATIRVPKSSVPKFGRRGLQGSRQRREEGPRQEAVRLPPQQAPPAEYGGRRFIGQARCHPPRAPPGAAAASPAPAP